MQSFNKDKFMQSDVALYGMFISVGMVLGYIESVIPNPIPIPGVKLGLANVLVLWVLYSMGAKAAAIINILRVVISGLLFGNLYSIIFSLAGALLSLTCMLFLKKFKAFTIVGVSVAGGVTHNIAQIIVSMIVLENARLVTYLPVLLISGIVAGIAIGVLGGLLYKKIRILSYEELKSNMGRNITKKNGEKK